MTKSNGTSKNNVRSEANSNSMIEIGRGKIAISVTAIIGILYALMNFAPIRNNGLASDIKNNSKRIFQCETNTEVILERLKYIEASLERIEKRIDVRTYYKDSAPR